MKEKKNNRNLLTGVIITVAVTVIAVFGAFIHEPWFDEAQAYVVARDASLHDILFYLPHYEGHPPLWHLILKAALIFGLPYELTLKGVQFIQSALQQNRKDTYTDELFYYLSILYYFKALHTSHACFTSCGYVL